MNFSSKITQLLIGISFGLVAGGLIIQAEPKIARANTNKIAQTLAPEEINLRAKQTIVRIDGANIGTGSIIDYADGVYTVLTNWHVMKNSGEYFVQTIDGRKHQVDPKAIQQLSNLDLAILKFDSNQNYQTIEIGDSANLNEGQNIYFAGYPGELRQEDNRYYRFFPASLVGILPKSTANGYSLIYNGEAFPGMSGGPVLNQQGLMIGVHGEANINAVSGGTSNYAIPIDTYKNEIALLNKPAESTDNSQPSTTATENSASESTSAEDTSASQPEEPEKQSQASPPESEQSEQTETTASDPERVSSVPTFAPKAKPDSKPAQPEGIAEPELEETKTEAAISEPEQPEETEAKAKPESDNSPVQPQKPDLVSRKTGIDYRQLRDLLKAKKWSEADIHTYRLVEQVVKTAKRENKGIYIELKTIANFSCPDIRTIDSLWQEYSGNKFGFSSQQKIWQTVNEKGDFSTQTWRQFATKVGWKKGEVNSGSGYLLYDQLDFDPNAAPSGHLPWWFALPEEEQKVIKQLFARCNFNPTPEELAAEVEAEKPRSAENTSNSDRNQPDINKPPKS